MSDRNKEVAQQLAPGARAPVLSATLLARVHGLNRDYVDLLLAEHGAAACAVSAESLPGKVLDALGYLSRDALAALTATPFALWSMRFDDPHFWQEALCDPQPVERADASLEARYGAPSVTSTRAAFCEIALFFAWHIAACNRVAARVLFAIPDGLAAMLVRVPLWRLQRIAFDFPALLTPRWPNNPAFWPDLARFAAAGDRQRLATTQLLGNQLLASELDGTLPPALRRQTRMRFR